MGLIINEKTTIKTQILILYSLLLVIGGGVALGVCLGLLTGAANTSKTNARSTIVSNTQDNCLIFAQEVSSAINQQLSLIGQTVSLQGAQYATNLESFTKQNYSLGNFPSYLDYTFNHSYCPNKCPPDFGSFGSSTRIPPESRFTEGSEEFSSVYVYSSSTGTSARDSSSYNQYVSSFPDVKEVVDSFSWMDLDSRLSYYKGPDTTVFYYLSTAIYHSNGEYMAIHRTFPGINKGDNVTYNPPLRSWFKRAPIDALYVYGPYVETFTKQNVLTLSSRKTFTTSLGNQASVVSAAVILLSSLQDVVNSIQYSNEGFAVLIGAKSPYYIFVNNNTTPYSNDENRFYTLSDLYPQLMRNGQPVFSNSVFDANINGTEYTIAPMSFFNTTDYSSGKLTDQFTILVFAKTLLAESPLNSLNSHVDETTNSVTSSTIIVVVATVGGVLFFVLLMVWYITYPLSKMKHISDQIVQISIEDDQNKDYSPAVLNAFFNQKRKDQVGVLTNEYFRVVCMLNNRAVDKKNQPKYPVNVFHVSGVEDYSLLAWTDLQQRTRGFQDFQEKLNDAPSETTSGVFTVDGELDILGSMNIRTIHPADTPTQSVSSNKPVVSVIESAQNSSTMDSRSIEMTAVASQVERDSAIINVEAVKVEIPKSLGPVNLFYSLELKLWSISLLMLGGLSIVLIITIIALNNSGNDWTNDTGAEILKKEISNINSIAVIKASFVKSFYEQMEVDAITGAQFASTVLNASHYYSNNPLSYPRDSNDYYAYLSSVSAGGSAFDSSYSSYFYKGWMDCKKTKSNQVCSTRYQQFNETKILSLTDVRFSSFYYSGTNFLSSVQIGMSKSQQIRTLPYTKNTDYSLPTRCFVSYFGTNYCRNLYENSACGNSGISSYPVYEPQCRSWYGLAVEGGDSSKVYFQYPRQSSGSGYVISAASPLKKNNEIIGAITLNFFANSLSNSVNNLRILGTGYSYVVDGLNTSNIILHPGASSTCGQVKCSEQFASEEEYNDFYTSVLDPLYRNTINQNENAFVAGSYTKQGETWLVATAPMNYNTIKYVVIVTVPLSTVEKPVNDVKDNINSSVQSILGAFIAFIVIFFFAVVYASCKIIHAIVSPVNELKTILSRVANDDLHGSVPQNASSLDMKVLLEAFAALMVALRFGSESYSRGDKLKAKEAFSEALQLYTATENFRGMASAHNNLGAAALNSRDFKDAREHFNKSIEMGEELMKQLLEKSKGKETEETKRLKRTISDRRGNLALLLLEEKSFSEAYKLLESLLQSDKSFGYIMGCVVKQGILGHNYLTQGEVKSARRTFNSALSFVRRSDNEESSDNSWNSLEASISEQIALYNLACLEDHEKNFSEASKLYLESLTKGRNMHADTTTKTLMALRNLYLSDGRDAQANSLTEFASSHDFQISGNVAGPKRIVFVVDYSGSMAGSKIKTAIENIKFIVNNHTSEVDYVSVITFTNTPSVIIPLSKVTNKDSILSILDSLNNPNGATSLYDALRNATAGLISSPFTDWVVALTDGEDNKSSLTHLDVVNMLKSKACDHINVIMMGIGSDVQSDTLEAISKASKKGKYIFAKADKASMNEAFGQVISLIRGQVVIED